MGKGPWVAGWQRNRCGEPQKQKRRWRGSQTALAEERRKGLAVIVASEPAVRVRRRGRRAASRAGQGASEWGAWSSPVRVEETPGPASRRIRHQENDVCLRTPSLRQRHTAPALGGRGEVPAPPTPPTGGALSPQSTKTAVRILLSPHYSPHCCFLREGALRPLAMPCRRSRHIFTPLCQNFWCPGKKFW